MSLFLFAEEKGASMGKKLAHGNIKKDKKLEEFALIYVKNKFHIQDTADEFGCCYRTALRYSENPKVMKIVNQEVEKLKNEKVADAREVLEYLTAVMRGEKKEQMALTVGVGEGMSEVTMVDKDVGQRERIRAAELLGKAYGIYTQNLDVKSDVQVIFENEKDIED